MNMKLIPEKLISENNIRGNRCYNIAILLSEIIRSNNTNYKSINSKLLRKLIREKLLLPTLTDKDLFDGDLKGHGDAVGGHGLHLECIKKRNSVEILLNKNNYEKCQSFIKKFNSIDNENEFRKIIGL